MGNILSVFIIVTVILLAVISFHFARKRALICPNCGHSKTVKTDEKRSIERKRRALIDSLPFSEFEYRCEKCNLKFWNSIEDIWK